MRPESNQPTRYVFRCACTRAAEGGAEPPVLDGAEATLAAGGGAAGGVAGVVRTGGGTGAAGGPGGAAGGPGTGGATVTVGEGTVGGAGSLVVDSVRVGAAGSLTRGLVIERAPPGACPAGGTVGRATEPAPGGRGASTPPIARAMIAAPSAAPPPMAIGRIQRRPTGTLASSQRPLSISSIQGLSSGSFSSACMTTRSPGAGVACRRPIGGGGSLSCLAMTASRVAASNGGVPERSSYAITASA